MRAGHYPVILSSLLGGLWVGVTRALIAGQHIGNTKLFGWFFAFHHGAEKFHAIAVIAHFVRGDDHTGEAIFALAKSPHLAVFVHAYHASLFGNRLRRR